MSQTPPTPLTPAPDPAPQRGDRTTFSIRVDAFVTWLISAVGEFSAIASNVYANALDAYSSAVAASASATSAGSSANNAVMAPGTNATSSTSNTIGTGTKNFTIQTGKLFAAGQFVVAAYTTTPANFMFGQINTYDSGNGALSIRVISTGGSGTFGAWTVTQSSSSVYTLPTQTGNAGKVLVTNGIVESWEVSPSASITRVQRTANQQLVAEDNSSWIDITSGTFTQSFATASTLGADWFVYFSNSGTGDIIIDPVELIDGLSSFVMYPGEVRVIETDGSQFYSIILNSFTKTFTANDNFIKPPGYGVFEGLLWSGGASGQRTNSVTTLSYGGCGGGCMHFKVTAAQLSASTAVVIGVGGTPISAVSVGNAGGFSSFGSLLKVYGGTDLIGGTVLSADGSTPLSTADLTNGNAFGYEGGRKAAAASATISGNSVYGGAAMNSTTNSTVQGGNSVYGGTAGGSLTAAAVVRAPGNSIFAGKGGVAVSASNGQPGVTPAGGGGATQTGAQSGAGARGELRIWGVL